MDKSGVILEKWVTDLNGSEPIIKIQSEAIKTIILFGKKKKHKRYPDADWLYIHRKAGSDETIEIPWYRHRSSYGFEYHQNKHDAIEYLKEHPLLFKKVMLKYPEWFV